MLTRNDTCRSLSDIHTEAVVGKGHAGRQRRAGGRMAEVMRNVCEIRLPRPNPAGHLDSLCEREVRGMRLMAQRVEHQVIEAVQQRE
jgi:hypothetical protein